MAATIVPAATRSSEDSRQGGVATSFTSQVNPVGQLSITSTRIGNSGATLEGAVVVLNFRVAAGAGAETRLVVQSSAPVGLPGRSLVGQPPAALVLTISP